jgi:hypothetical protein
MTRRGAAACLLAWGLCAGPGCTLGVDVPVTQVACAIDTDCPSGAVCDATGRCTLDDLGVRDPGGLDLGPPWDGGLAERERCDLDDDQCAYGLACYHGGGGAEDAFCLPVGLARVDEACFASNGCRPGLACFPINGQAGQCQAPCETRATCAGAALCVAQGGRSYCAPSCDPITSAGCIGARPACLVTDANLDAPGVFCTIAGQRTVGEVCAFGVAQDALCAAPYVCIPDQDAVPRCRQVCGVDAPDCGAGACSGLGVTVAGVRLGVCL